MSGNRHVLIIQTKDDWENVIDPLPTTFISAAFLTKK
jgi:hypothetical protein